MGEAVDIANGLVPFGAEGSACSLEANVTSHDRLPISTLFAGKGTTMRAWGSDKPIKLSSAFLDRRQFMAISAGILLVIGGFCACAPLFQRVSKGLERFPEFVGFFVGIIILIVAVDYSFGGNLLYTAIQTPSHTSSAYAYMKYFLPSLITLGVLLVSRPIKNIQWASLISLALGLLVPYFLSVLVPTLSLTVLAIVLLIAAVAIYTLLRFVEDIFRLVASILAFTPIALAIGLINIYFGVLLWSAPALG